MKINIRPDHLKFDVSVHTEIFWFQTLGILTNLSAICGTGINELIEKLIVFFTEETFEKQEIFAKFSICSPFKLIAVLKKQLFSFEIFLSNKWAALTHSSSSHYHVWIYRICKANQYVLHSEWGLTMYTDQKGPKNHLHNKQSFTSKYYSQFSALFLLP